jgi:hypothetical protein
MRGEDKPTLVQTGDVVHQRPGIAAGNALEVNGRRPASRLNRLTSGPR